ncbi:MAG: hypothetical protein ABIO70_05040 [Pseudomonadota bacterium]
MRLPLYALLILAVGCRFRREADDTTDSLSDDTTAPDDTQDTRDTGPVVEDPLLGVEQISFDNTGFGIYGLAHATYEMSAQHQGGYRTTEDTNPRFHLVAKPSAFVDGLPHPVLVWLHGGVAGVIGDETMLGQTCELAGVEELIENALRGHPLILAELAAREWIMMVPESTWCDVWAGLGPEDPVDTRHASLAHIDWTLRALEAGLDGIAVDTSRYYAWGTSVGGAGVWPVAHGFPGQHRPFAAVVSDSGPMILTTWYDTLQGQSVLDSLLGGPPTDGESPTEWYPNWQRADGQLLVEEMGLRTPAFVAFNTQDHICSPVYGDTITGVMEAIYTPEGARFFSHDFDHAGPGEFAHTQTVQDDPPAIYTAEAAFSFLEGAGVSFTEAETTCPDCQVETAPEDATFTDHMTHFSASAAVVRLASDGPGALYEGVLGGDIPRGVGLRLMVTLDIDDISACDAKDRVVSFALAAGEETLATGGLLPAEVADLGSPVGLAMTQIARSTLAAPTGLPAEGDVTLTVTTNGCADVWLDGYWALWAE